MATAASLSKSRVIDAISITPKQKPKKIDFLEPGLSTEKAGFKFPSVYGPYGVTKVGPAPGDVHTGTSLRPLGLLRSKLKKTHVWNELSVLIHNRSTVNGSEKGTVSSFENGGSSTLPCDVSSHSHGLVTKRVIEVKQHSGAMDDDDPEYLRTLALCDLKEFPKEYNSRAKEPPHMSHQPATTHQSSNRFLPVIFKHPNPVKGTMAMGTKPAKYDARMRNPLLERRSLEYLSFFGQAHLNKRDLFLDHRQSKDYEPCERCALRGVRCHHCKAIRTGGGYIILDDIQMDAFMDSRGSSSLGGGPAAAYRQRNRSLLSSRGSRRPRESEIEELDYINSEEEEGFKGIHSDRSKTSRREGLGLIDGDTGTIQGGNYRGSSGEGLGTYGNNSKSGVDALHSLGQVDEATTSSYDGSRTKYAEDNGFGDSSQEKPGDMMSNDGNKGLDLPTGDLGTDPQLKTGALRCDNTLGDEGVDRDGLPLKHQNEETADGWKGEGGKDRLHQRSNNQKVKFGSKKFNDSGVLNQSYNEATRGTKSIDATDNTFKVNGELGITKRNEEENDTLSSHYSGDLMRFKSKRDKVRAKSCTLRELKGIDPLDYLAKYCIIDQEKVPHYQKVFDNVDLDEDNEISVLELDFALKAVNYNLISDAELTYVNKVLELAGRYALNFQLFCLVAALSEKVVSLDDMVKRLVNVMDFEALETKMKKCKELFYLLANHDDEDDGVVTASALGIELQAGGLTQEHVEYVIDHLDHQDKGIIEFLDYLVYVPLFLEIHGSISSNPLDFSRTK